MPGRMTVAEALNQAGQELQAQHGASIPTSELVRRVVELCGCRESSVLPADFCYNWTNAGVPSSNRPLFLRVGHGRYRYVGQDYVYEGEVLRNPRKPFE